MIYRASYILTMTGYVIEDGAVAVKDGRIRDVGRYKSIKRERTDKIIDCRPLILMPGLINSHTHLEEGMLRSRLDPPQTFASWHARVIKYLMESDINSRLNAVRLGCRESIFCGTTTIADTALTGASFLILREENIRSFVFLAVQGAVPWEAESIFSKANDRMELLDRVYRKENIGLSAISPYSASVELYRLVLQNAKKSGSIFQTHLAESNEELEMFSSHSGPLYEYSMRKYGADLRDYIKGSAFFMFKKNLIPTKSIAVHGNYLSGDEFASLAERNVSLVHCPQSHDFFQHKEFPFETALARGVNICLGTESLASSPNLNLFDEMFCIKRKHPELDSETILSFATINGAAALGMGDKTGKLAPGFAADMIGVRLAYKPEENLYDELILGDPQVEFVMVNGEEVIS